MTTCNAWSAAHKFRHIGLHLLGNVVIEFCEVQCLGFHQLLDCEAFRPAQVSLVQTRILKSAPMT